MSIFGDIMHKIWTAAEGTVLKAPVADEAPANLTPIGNATVAAAAPPDVTATLAPVAGLQTPAAGTSQPVDVGAVLAQMAAQKGGGGNYKVSIVDLLMLLGLDSSLAARKQLANELDVHVGADGTAEENIALHKAVMTKLADNGGVVPAGLS